MKNLFLPLLALMLFLTTTHYVKAQVHTFTNNTACTLYVELTFYFDDGSSGPCGVVCEDFIKTETSTVPPGQQFITNNGPFGSSAGNWGLLLVVDPSADGEEAGPCATSPSGPITCNGSTITVNWIDCYNSDAS